MPHTMPLAYIIKSGGLLMYEPGVGGYGGGIGGAGTATAAAIILPNTGAHWMLTVLTMATLAVGVVVSVSSFARIIAKHTSS